MLLPFQAIECYLDEVLPFEGKFSIKKDFFLFFYYSNLTSLYFKGTEEEGKNFLSQFIKNSYLKAKFTGYAEDGIPLIKLFKIQDSEVKLLIFLRTKSTFLNK